jgi:capsular exopolysaccharide synthesis family protein
MVIEPTPPQPLGRQVQAIVDLGGSGYWNNKEYYETQFKILQSQRVAVDVIRTLGLNRDPGFLGNASAGQVLPPSETTVERAANALRSRITVEPVRNSRLVTVSVDDADPSRAQRVVNALTDTYLEQNIDVVLSSTNSAAEWLRSQVDKLKGELETSEFALHTYKEGKQILSVSIDDQSNMLREEIKTFNDELTRARARREQIAARRDQLAKIDSPDPTDLPASELLSSAILQQIRQEYLSARKEHDSLVGQGKGENHPDVMAAAAKIAANRSALLAEVANVRGALDRDLRVIEHEISGLSGLFEAAKHRALDLNLLEIEYHRLERTKVNNEKLYSLVLERSKETDLTRLLRFNNARVIDAAQVPGAPISPRVAVNLAAGLFLGFLAGILAVLGREYVDRSIKTPDDVENELGVTFLGLLPEISTRGKGRNRTYGRRRKRPETSPEGQPPELMAHYDSSSGLAEAARAIRTNLMFMAPDRPFRRLLVTSAGPSEGKTMVACCVAVAMAQAGQKVLILDCDLRRPRLHRVFNISNDVGVTAALLDQANIDTFVSHTAVANLDVLPAGAHVPNPAELLQSASFGKMLDALQTKYDRIIIDSPPVVPVTDPAILSKNVDGALLVIRAFRTTRDLTRQAIRSLRDVGAPLIGTILNAVDLSRREYGYYHYYYYKKEGYRSPPKVAEA